MKQVLTQQEREGFDKNGFLIIENALSSVEIAELVAVADDLYGRYEAETGTGRLEIRNCLAQHRSLLNLVTHAKILPVVVGLLGPNIKIRSSHLDIRPPVASESVTNQLGQERWGEPEQWHIDGPLYGYPSIKGLVPMMEIKVGYYLTDVVESDSGALCVVPGSLHFDYRALAVKKPKIPEEYVYRVQVPKGAAIIFRTGLWHCVASNLSNTTRKVLYYAYTFRWIEASDYFTQSEEILATCTPIQRQLLGATASPARSPLGNEPAKTPCSFYWYTEPQDLPLQAWFDELHAATA
jgi:ectoine hydroxylase